MQPPSELLLETGGEFQGQSGSRLPRFLETFWFDVLAVENTALNGWCVRSGVSVSVSTFAWRSRVVLCFASRVSVFVWVRGEGSPTAAGSALGSRIGADAVGRTVAAWTRRWATTAEHWRGPACVARLLCPAFAFADADADPVQLVQRGCGGKIESTKVNMVTITCLGFRSGLIMILTRYYWSWFSLVLCSP